MDCNALALFGAREAGSFRQVADLHRDHLRQAPLYAYCTYAERLTNELTLKFLLVSEGDNACVLTSGEGE